MTDVTSDKKPVKPTAPSDAKPIDKSTTVPTTDLTKNGAIKPS